MASIREYRQEDAPAVGRLIAKVYGEINLAFLPEEQRGPYLGPFQNALTNDPVHQQQIAQTLSAPMVFIAEEKDAIVGVLRGSVGRLHSLFVDQNYHRRGIGKQLYNHFEGRCRECGAEKITLAATLFAVPFYQAIGFKKSTGVRKGWSFEGENFVWQPMKKVLSPIPG